MTSKTPVRSAEDVDEKALSYGEIKALATGNPEILKKTQLDAEVSKLQLLKQSYLSQIYDLEDKITQIYPKEIKEYEEKIKAYEYDKQYLEENTIPNAEGFCKMTIKGIEYVQKEKAGKALIETCSKKQNKEDEEIGMYRGFKLELGFNSLQKVFTLSIKNKTTLRIDLGSDVYGNIQRIDNAFSKMDSLQRENEEELENVKKQLEVAKIEVKKPFTKEEELQQKQKELDEINILLNINERKNEVIVENREIIEDEEKKSKEPNRDDTR